MTRLLRLDTIKDVGDDDFEAEFNAALRAAEEDCRNRPGIEKPRTVTLSVRITPSQEDGKLSTVRTAIDVKKAFPVRKSGECVMLPTVMGFEFNENCSENPAQETIEDAVAKLDKAIDGAVVAVARSRAKKAAAKEDDEKPVRARSKRGPRRTRKS